MTSSLNDLAKRQLHTAHTHELEDSMAAAARPDDDTVQKRGPYTTKGEGEFATAHQNVEHAKLILSKPNRANQGLSFARWSCCASLEA